MHPRDIARQLREFAEQASDLGEELGPLVIKLDNPQATGQTVRMEFEYQGVVTQSTGEDWDDVKLLLSTANPTVAGVMPTLQPWFLGRAGWSGGDIGGTLETGKGFFVPPSAAGVMGSASDVLESRMDAAIEGSGAVVFAVPGLRSIAGDGSERQVVEVTDQLPVSELDRVVVKSLAISDGEAPVPAPDSGLLEWRIAVEDGAYKEIDFRFSVTAPVGTPALRAMEMLF
jgi:hypothetical protein